MKHTKTAALLLAAIMALSACGNGNSASDTEKEETKVKTKATTEAATENIQTDDAQGADSENNDVPADDTTAEAAEETTTETEPAAPAAEEGTPTIKIEGEDDIQYFGDFINGEAAILNGYKQVLFVNEKGEIRSVDLMKETPIAFSNFIYMAEGVYGAYLRDNHIFLLLDADGNAINDKYLTVENENIQNIGEGSMLVRKRFYPEGYDYSESDIFGLMDFNGNWIAEPSEDNVFNKCYKEMYNQGHGVPSTCVFNNYAVCLWYGIECKVFDLKNNKTLAEIDASSYDFAFFYDSTISENYIHIPAKRNKDKDSNTYIRIDLTTGEQTTVEIEGSPYAKNAFEIEKNKLALYDNALNKLAEVSDKDIVWYYEDGYWVKENGGYTYYTIDGKEKLVLKFE